MNENDEEFHDLGEGEDQRSSEDSSSPEQPKSSEQQSNQEPDKNSDSSFGTWALWGCGGCMVTVLLVGFIVGFTGYYYVSSHITTNSPQVKKKAQDILPHQFPGSSKGTVAFDIFFDFATVLDRLGDFNLILAVGRYEGKLSKEQQMNGLRNFNQNFRQGQIDTIDSQVTLNRKLCNKTIEVTKITGSKYVGNSKEKMIRYQTCFVHQGVTYCYVAVGRGSKGQRQIEPLVNSIQCPR
ncbi:MAG: hypothetical protein ABEJ65_08375 [bacterium]